jgi:hypothetical protein
MLAGSGSPDSRGRIDFRLGKGEIYVCLAPGAVCVSGGENNVE